MKKVLVMFIAFVVLFAMVSCKDEPHVHSWDEGTDNGNGKYVYKCSGCDETKSEYMTFEIGDEGPGGGFVFYDCDADNTQEDPDGADNLKSSVCGWRYLEAAAVASEATCQFGYFRETDSSPNLTVGGTGTAIGTGKSNTDKLVTAMGAEAYTASSGSEKTASYAAKHCADCNAGGKTDWFLPSKDELALIYTNLRLNNKGNFDIGNSYISSSEKNSYSAEGQVFINGNLTDFSRNNTCKVRPVRQF